MTQIYIELPSWLIALFCIPLTLFTINNLLGIYTNYLKYKMNKKRSA